MRRVKRGEAEQTIVDITDNRKLIVMISTSKARQIIYNPNNGTYNPDFSKEPMVLTPELYITGSPTNVIATAETVKWYVRPNTLGQRIPIENNDTYSIGNDFKLTISKNIMKDMLTMEFILEVIYKEPDSDFRTTIPHHIELVNISMGEDGRDGIDGLDGLDGERGLPGPKGADGESSYTHLAYANNETGTQDFSLSDSNRSYIGMYVDNLENDSTNPSDYKWTRVEGMPGDKGIQGPKGEDGRTPYFHIAYATSEYGTEGFSVSDSVGKTYIGQYTDYIENDSTKPSDYSWTKIKGEKGEQGPRGLQGLQGPQGDQGLQGPKGLDSYTHIAYANNETGTSGFSTSDSINKIYIGMYVDNTKSDSTNPSDYNWTLIKGEKGEDGSQGIPGKPGADGRTPYLHIAYANITQDNVLDTGNSVEGKGYLSNSTTLSDLETSTAILDPIPILPGKNYRFVKNSKSSDKDRYWRIVVADSNKTLLQRMVFLENDMGWTAGTNDYFIYVSYPTESQPRVYGETIDSFSTTESRNKTHIGQYTDYIKNDSEKFLDYDWTLIKGSDGYSPNPNLLFQSNKLFKSSEDYNINNYKTTEFIEHGEVVTLTIWGNATERGGFYNPHNSGGSIPLGRVYEVSPGVYSNTFKWRNEFSTSNPITTYDQQYVYMYAGAGGSTYSNTAPADIYKVKLERGSVSTPWSPAESEMTGSATLAIITPDGTTVRDTTSSLKLESKLFVGGREVTASSYKWYYSNGSSTVTHSTGKSTIIGATLVKNSLTIFLDATYNGTTYTSSVTINDISDVYTSIILGVATFKNGKGSNTYTVKLYRNGEEIDTGGSQYSYEWEKLNSQGVKDTKFNKTGKTIVINASEIDNTNLFNCYIYTK